MTPPLTMNETIAKKSFDTLQCHNNSAVAGRMGVQGRDLGQQEYELGSS